MSKEGKYIFINRIIAIAVTVVCIIVIIAISTPKSEAAFVDDNGYIESYYESLDSTTCEIVLKFDKNVNGADATVSFYDADGNLLDTQRETFFGYEAIEVSRTFYVDGKVEYYSVEDISVEMPGVSEEVIITDIILLLIVLCWLLCAFMLSCKEYEYNDHHIVVYAGFVKHYIKIDGEKMDEYNTAVSFVPITMSTTLVSGEIIDATISLSNRISVKLNNRLLAPIKTTLKDGKDTNKNANVSVKKTDIDNIPNENNCITDYNEDRKDTDIGNKNM